MNTSCGDTVKCRLDAGKSPIFRSQSPCTYIYVQESQRFRDFVRIYTYESRKGLSSLCNSPLLNSWQRNCATQFFENVCFITSPSNEVCDNTNTAPRQIL